MKRTKKAAMTCSIAVIIGLVVRLYSDEIRTTRPGLEIIGRAEGCMREPYLCPAGVRTIGIGSAGEIVIGKIYSDEEIAKRWVDDIKTAERCINRWANGDNLPQPVFEALTSLAFNVGCGKLKYSTIFKYAKQNNIEGLCNELPKWKFSNGKLLEGLAIRREKERKWCLTGLPKP